ncbi:MULTISPECIES: DUF5665 domain-containing protein [Shouchella]|uniref:DUF5665 domain-containing protein n=1 Tax=Shouchella TaxID=2893057 RepID=UPI000A891A72|nr:MULTISPECIES: DUF5665 domain-containing protein [Bacillaceae]
MAFGLTLPTNGYSKVDERIGGIHLPLTDDQKSRMLPSKHRQREIEKQSDENDRFHALLDKLEDVTTNGRLKDMAFHFTDTKQVVKSNLIAGIARGVGLTIGVALFVSLLLAILNLFEPLPIIGEWLANLANIIEANR